MALSPSSAQALEYQTCISAEQSAACLIAFEKIQTQINPITKERYFHNDIHIRNSKDLIRFPLLYIATPDLDSDGSPELIVSVPEETHDEFGMFCIEVTQCPHFIIQDRVLDGETRTLSSYKAIGPIYTYALALSTDEVVDNYKSLRAYFDKTWQEFNVYQYDKSADNYFNVSAQ